LTSFVEYDKNVKKYTSLDGNLVVLLSLLKRAGVWCEPVHIEETNYLPELSL
jgi:hypothetical protein